MNMRKRDMHSQRKTTLHRHPIAAMNLRSQHILLWFNGMIWKNRQFSSLYPHCTL